MSDAKLQIDGVAFLIPRGRRILLERCPKKAAKLGVGEWFVPGGKIEPGETEWDALAREIREELGISGIAACPLPLIQASALKRPIFLMRPFVVTYAGKVPDRCLDNGVELRWVDIMEAICSPVPQVRMMVAALDMLRPQQGVVVDV